VFFRDFQNIVSTLTIFTHWAVPMIYPYSKLANSSLGDTWFLQLYLANPLTEAVLLMQRCFWLPLTNDPKAARVEAFPADLWSRGVIMLVASFVALGLAQVWFSKLERRVPERL
jgi:ABC-2 type transport system permease protein